MGALAAPRSADPPLLSEAGDPFTVRPSELVRDLRDRVRRLGREAPTQIRVTTARGRLLGTVEASSLEPGGAPVAKGSNA